MVRHRSWILLVSLFFILLFSFSFGFVSAYSEDEAYGSVRRAEEAVSSAFVDVLGAEGVGANVSSLIVGLNRAVGFLSEAELCLKNGDFDEAVRLAGWAVEVVEGGDRWELDGVVMRWVRVEGVRSEALRLGASALSRRDFLFRVCLAVLVFGVPFFLLLMFFLWRWFRGSYTRRVLGMRPGVVLDVES